ncbi:MAG: N-acetyltransferase family protein [Bdellovibrionales bacterium]
MIITLRPATEADREFSRQAHHTAYYDTIVKQFGPFDEVQQDGFFTEAWDACPHWMVEFKGQTCGYVSFEEKSGCMFVNELVIQPDFHGQGIGAAFIRIMKDKAAEAGKPLRLSMLLMNTAYDFYIKQGFTETSRDTKSMYMEWQPV